MFLHLPLILRTQGLAFGCVGHLQQQGTVGMNSLLARAGPPLT